MALITSLKNSKVKFVRALINHRRHRNKHDAFFIEGVHALTEAYRHGWKVRMLLYDPAGAQSEWAWEIIAQTPLEARVEVNDYVMGELSDRHSPSELLAVVEQRPDDLARIPLQPNLLLLLLDRPRSPGNLGSTLRSADALGAQGVLITGHAVDVYDPKTVRASMGALFAMPAVRVPEHAVLEQWLNEARAALGQVQLVATSADAETVAYHHDFTVPTILAIGNERMGMSRYLEELCDAYVTIPMYGEASTSFNASVAASILLYEARRQREVASANRKISKS